MQDGIEERLLGFEVGGTLSQQAGHADALALAAGPDAEGIGASSGAQLLAIAVAREEVVDGLDAAHLAEDREAGGIEAVVIGEVDKDVGRKSLSTVGVGGAIGVFARLVHSLHGKGDVSPFISWGVHRPSGVDAHA